MAVSQWLEFESENLTEERQGTEVKISLHLEGAAALIKVIYKFTYQKMKLRGQSTKWEDLLQVLEKSVPFTKSISKHSELLMYDGPTRNLKDISSLDIGETFYYKFVRYNPLPGGRKKYERIAWLTDQSHPNQVFSMSLDQLRKKHKTYISN